MPDFTISSYSIGVDGGGSKTELILVDDAGTSLARHTAPGCNPSQCGPEQAREILQAGLKALLVSVPNSDLRSSISETHLFMAGSAVTWREIASSLTGFGLVLVAADSLPVLELATAGASGVVLHAGTGSFIAARASDGAIHYAGGLGWKIGDPGSGFDLGRRGLAQALLELQGWAPPSGLGDALHAHTGLPDYAENSRFFYSDPDANARIAAFAPQVLALAGQADSPALAALAASLSDLVEQARLVTAKLFGESTVPCGVSGAILNAAPSVAALHALAATHRWPVTLNFITASPIEGVRRLLVSL